MRYKVALAVLSLFLFVALPAIGQELHIQSLKKLDPLSWGSQILLAEEDEQHHEITVDHHSVAGESEAEKDDPALIKFLRDILGSAMKFD